MNSTCTKGVFLLGLAFLLIGAAACTQAKPSVPTPTLVPLNQTPVLIASTPEVTSAPVGTAPASTSAAITPELTAGASTAVPVEPTLLPTPTSGIATSAPQPAATQAPSTSGGTTTGGACSSKYTVQGGDWAYQIARKCGISYQALVAANPGVNLATVYAGQVLNIPGGGSAPSGGTSGGGTSGRTYVVQRGDTLFSIATRFGTTVAALASLNGISDPSSIFVGQTLKIP